MATIRPAGAHTNTSPQSRRGDEWLIAIDLDGTTIDEAGQASDAVKTALRRVGQAGHHLLVATGRSAVTTLTVLDEIEVWPEYVVCSNGGMVLRRDRNDATGYRRLRATSFEVPTVLNTIRRELPTALFAVEREDGTYRFTHPFPPATTEPIEEQTIVGFDELATGKAVRAVILAPGADVLAFRKTVERLRLPGTTFSLGWTAWLDIAAAGVTKASAAEEVRVALGFSRAHVIAIGDGYNDIELIQWAGEYGRGVAMGHSPESLLNVASEITGTILEDGLATALSSL
ncbi:MAG TPA: HAD-IIB family hydrolase [Plantibacter sp.]|uniref:HAD family hydrolase n=1 Tax=unclassified Plantibacter TaxID=2624265 RepID=UPI002B925BC4|nr:HAD-IIB family hydrolase [Plantibacter sp.]